MTATALSRITVARLLQSTVTAVVGIILAGEIAKALAHVHAGRVEEINVFMRFWLFAMFSDEKLASLAEATHPGWQIATLLPSLLIISSLAYALWILLRSPDRKEVQL